ncbi:hypothetical protein EHJ09_11685 [Cronobacter turicensis]|nr:hypothetical protein [Cronobacter turicensis]
MIDYFNYHSITDQKGQAIFPINYYCKGSLRLPHQTKILSLEIRWRLKDGLYNSNTPAIQRAIYFRHAPRAENNGDNYYVVE